MRPNLILLLAVLFCVTESVSAQNTNPFELLWRKDTISSSVPLTAPVPEPRVPIPASVPAPDDTLTLEGSLAVLPEEVRDTIENAVETVQTDTVIQKDSATEAFVEKETMVLENPPAESGSTLPKTESSLLLVILFGIIFSLLAWVLSLNREVLQKIYRAALNENLSSLLFREQRFATTQYLYYTIYLIFFLNAGMFLYFLSRQFGWEAWALSTVWSCIAIVFVVYMLRHIWMAILGSTYPVTKEMTHFSFSILLHNILLGISLIPVNLFLAFGPEGMYKSVAVIGILICLLIYLMRQFRGLVISGSVIGTHPFHFFVYLCAVEILPLFTLVKFFHN